MWKSGAKRALQGGGVGQGAAAKLRTVGHEVNAPSIFDDAMNTGAAPPLLRSRTVEQAAAKPRHYDDKYRPDIDGLRAVAVISVIVFHFFGDMLPSGYLGVDVFFVISGYVITAYLFRVPKASRADFFLTFYARRIKRLLPALLVCIVVTALIFVATATRPPREVFNTGALALLGFSNISLLVISHDYFGLDAHLNPFTHTWSLGVEEQFYMIYPAIFATAGYSWARLRPEWRRLRFYLLALAAASLLLYLVLSAVSPGAAFYLMPARFWELGAGALIFVASKGRMPRTGSALAPWAGAVLLLACFMLPASWQPFNTILAVASASLLIGALQPHHAAYRALAFRPVVFIGKISYSLYLWHWSMLVLGRWTIGDTLAASLLLLALTVLAALGSYFFVEKPLRYADWARSPRATLVTGLCVVIPLFVAVLQVPLLALSTNNNLPGLFGVTPPPAWPNLACHGRAALAKLPNPFETCLSAQRTAEKPNLLFVLGDSHAAELTFMAAAAVKELPFTVRFINVEDARDFPAGFNEGGRESKVLDYLSDRLNPGDVIAVAFHRGYFNKRRDKHVPLNAAVRANAKAEAFVNGFRPYIAQWEKRGVKAVLIHDTPLMNAVATSSACFLQIKLFGHSICRVSAAQDLHTRAAQDRAFENLAASSRNVVLWDPLPHIYRGNPTLDVVDGEGNYIMLDWNHITEYQSVLLAPVFQAFLKERVLRAD